MATSTQVAVFLLMYLTYVVYYFLRSNYSVWLKALVQEEGLSMSESGQFASAFETLCGFSKLFGGILVDLFDPSVVVAVCSLVCGVVNLLMFRFGELNAVVYVVVVLGHAVARAWVVM